jgi:hypothetical protein
MKRSRRNQNNSYKQNVSELAPATHWHTYARCEDGRNSRNHPAPPAMFESLFRCYGRTRIHDAEK